MIVFKVYMMICSILDLFSSRNQGNNEQYNENEEKYLGNTGRTCGNSSKSKNGGHNGQNYKGDGPT